MSEWLTTGQMIDRLKVGEVAESNDELKAWYNEIKELRFQTEKSGESYKFVVDEMDYKKERKWRILPKYVSFEEAMKASIQGKTVSSWLDDEEKPYHNHYPESYILGDLELHKFNLIGDELTRFNEIKWTIDD